MKGVCFEMNDNYGVKANYQIIAYAYIYRQDLGFVRLLLLLYQNR